MMKAYQSQLALLNHLPGMVYRCKFTPERRLLFASEGCLALTGFTATELIAAGGMAYGELIHGEDQALVQLEIETALQEKRPYYCIYRLITADQQERWVRESGQGVFAENGTLIALDGFVTDADDRALASNVALQRVADLTRKLSAVRDILEALSTPADLPIILQKSLNAALVAAQGDAGFIHLRVESGRSMRLVVQQGMPDLVIKTITTISAEDGLVAWVAQKSAPLHIPSIGEDPRTVYLADSGDLKAYVGVPISREQRVWGTLSVLGRDPSQFADEEVDLLTSVGEEIGMVLENARLHRQADKLLLVQERNRLARELHDSVTQSLYSVTLFAEAGRRTALVQGNAEAADYFNQIGETGQQALKEMRLLIHKLRPPILAEEGLARALQQRLNSVEGRAGVKNQIIVEGEAALSPSLEDALYQIAQEALNNALKHAMATEVIVRLNFSHAEETVLQVEDNGRGFDPSTAATSDGMGLTSMQERAKSLDGELIIRSAPGQGTTVEVRLPLAAKTLRPLLGFEGEDLL